MEPYVWLPNIGSKPTGQEVLSNGLICGVRQDGAKDMAVAVVGQTKLVYFRGTSGLTAGLRITNIKNNIMSYGVDTNGPNNVSNVYSSTSYNALFVYGSPIGTVGSWTTIQPDVQIYDNLTEAYNAANDGSWEGYKEKYPITYSSSNSTVSGPLEAAVGDTVTVSAVPDVGYGITDASTQILVTNNDVAVPYTWDAANNRITFTMPDPS